MRQIRQDPAVAYSAPARRQATWSGQRIARLAELWDLQWTAAEIAAVINREFGAAFSRSSIIGKVRRLGLSVRGTGWRRDASLARPIPARLASPAPPASFDPKQEAERARVSEREQSADAVAFLARSRKQCAWPLWDAATPSAEREVCGARRVTPQDPRRPYCAHHARIAYRRPELIANPPVLA
jgi:hypothetical protein